MKRLTGGTGCGIGCNNPFYEQRESAMENDNIRVHEKIRIRIREERLNERAMMQDEDEPRYTRAEWEKIMEDEERMRREENHAWHEELKASLKKRRGY